MAGLVETVGSLRFLCHRMLCPTLEKKEYSD
ncbi:Uncharacterised protein [Segatella copri]|nr:Uncharacterised protein [Segatella copri]